MISRQDYNNKVDQHLRKLEYQYELRRRSKKKTGIESVLIYMLENREKIWWWSWEFVGKETSKGGYLSHRAPARASDLAIKFLELVEDKRIGRFKVYRLRLENLEEINNFLKN